MPGRKKNSYPTLLNRRGSVLLTSLLYPGATQQQLADRLGLHFQHVNNDLSELVAAGVLSRERKGRRVFYTLTPEAQESNPDLSLIMTVVDTLVDAH